MAKLLAHRIRNKISNVSLRCTREISLRIKRTLNKPKHRVFCIGFQKTGTTSLGKALTELGYRIESTPHQLRYSWIKDLHQNEQRKGLFLQLFEARFDACEDNPFPLHFQDLYELFPSAKFILTIRDERAWIRSAQNHFGGHPTPMLDYVYSKYKTDPVQDETLWLEKYRNHNQSVIEFFKRKGDDQLLVMRTEEMSFKKLADFLDFPNISSNKAFPHENKREYQK